MIVPDSSYEKDSREDEKRKGSRWGKGQAKQALFFSRRQIANGEEGCRVDLAACEVEYSNSAGMLLKDKQSFEVVGRSGYEHRP